MENQNGYELLKERAKSLAVMLTLEEKIGMIHGGTSFFHAGVERLGIPPLVMSDGPMGVRQEFELNTGKPSEVRRIMRRICPVTARWLPRGTAIWHLPRAVCLARRQEEGKDIILAPGINIKRSPLCGRNFRVFQRRSVSDRRAGSLFYTRHTAVGRGCLREALRRE